MLDWPIESSWLFWLAISLLGFTIYFIPTVIAFARRHRRTVSILIFNFLTGWTLIGWIGALVWALLPEKVISPASSSKSF